MSHDTPIARCIGCGCTDVWACDVGCYWLAVDYGAGKGVCSECPEELERFASEEQDEDPIVAFPERIPGRGG